MLIVWLRVKDETMETIMKYLKERLKKCNRLYVCYREMELIEANVAPLVSGGLQSPMKVGLKPRLSTLGKAVLGYDPVKLISIWSKSHVKYEGVYGRY